jgi:hypothetical protein
MSNFVKLLWLVAMASLAASSAGAASVKEIFEKYDLIGIFAPDCSKPLSGSNLYYVHRVLGADHLQRDIMVGPQTRRYLVTIDKAVEVGGGTIVLSGNRDGKSFNSIYRVERGRLGVIEAVVDGKVEITKGKFANGSEMPWVSKCAGIP